jgi:hypothetical protein
MNEYISKKAKDQQQEKHQRCDIAIPNHNGMHSIVCKSEETASVSQMLTFPNHDGISPFLIPTTTTTKTNNVTSFSSSILELLSIITHHQSKTKQNKQTQIQAAFFLSCALSLFLSLSLFQAA